MMWPTPTQDIINNRRERYQQGGLSLNTAVMFPDAEPGARPAGSLNPAWVSWLMGWPVGWASADPLGDVVMPGWEFEPDIPRLATGVKDRDNQLRVLGNGQVPACFVVAWELLTAGLDE
jgi:DNA (cytosine-5)-methyltransferase 1